MSGRPTSIESKDSPNSASRPFELELLDQYWIDGSKVQLSGPGDITSHGKVLLKIRGEDISGCEDEATDYGINQSAVALLRTVFVDHTPQNPRDARLTPIFFHGCTIWGTCPRCVIDFRVRHLQDGNVVLDHFYVTGGPDGADPMRFHDKIAQLPNSEYAEQVLRFSRMALAFLPPDKGDAWEVPHYERLRKEIRTLCSMVEEYLSGETLSGEILFRAGDFDLIECKRRSPGQGSGDEAPA